MYKVKKVALAVLVAFATGSAMAGGSKVDFRPPNYVSAGSSSNDDFVGYQDSFVGMVAGNANMKLFVGHNLPGVDANDKSVFSDLFFLRNDGVVFRPNQYPLSGTDDEVTRLGVLPNPSTVSWIWHQRLDSQFQSIPDWWAFDQTKKTIYKNGSAFLTGISNLFALPVNLVGGASWMPLFYSAEAGKVYGYDGSGVSVPVGSLTATSKFYVLPSRNNSLNSANVFYQDGDGQMWYLMGDVAQSTATRLGQASDAFTFYFNEVGANVLVYRDLAGGVHNVYAGTKTVNNGMPTGWYSTPIAGWPDKILATTSEAGKSGVVFVRDGKTYYMGGASSQENILANFVAKDVAFLERNDRQIVLLSPSGDAVRVSSDGYGFGGASTIATGVDQLVKAPKSPESWLRGSIYNSGYTSQRESFGNNENFVALKLAAGGYKDVKGNDATAIAQSALAKQPSQDGYIERVTGGFKVNLWGADAFAYTTQTTESSDLIAVDAGLVFDIHADGNVLASRASAPWNSGLRYYNGDYFQTDATNYAKYLMGKSLPYDSSKSAQLTGFAEFLPLMPPTSVSATDAAFKDKVVITWAADKTTIYDVLRKDSAPGSQFVVLATTDPGVAKYEDLTAVQGVNYIYAVVAKRPALGSGSFLTSDMSGQDAGRVGLPPFGVGGVLKVDANSLNNVLKPVVDSKDTADTYTYTVGANGPKHGKASNDKLGNLVYTPEQNFYGQDNFDVLATSAAGYQVSGNVGVNVTCPAPVIKGVAAPSGYQAEFTSTNVAVTFDSNLCNATMDVVAEVMDSSGNVLSNLTQNSSVGSGSNGSVAFKFKDLPAGSYTTRITVKSPSSGNTATSGASLRYARLSAPLLGVDKTSLTEDTTVAVALTPTTGSCTPTADSSAALADPSKCLVTWTDVPNGMTATGTGFVGRPFQGANQHIGVKFAVFDSTGAEHVIGTRDQYLNVFPPQAPSIGIDRYPAGGSWFVHKDYVAANLAVSSGFACSLFTDTAAAAAAANNGSIDGKVPKVCYLDVKHVPAGITLAGSSDGKVSISGRLEDPNDSVVKLDVYKVTTGTANALLAEGVSVPLPAKPLLLGARLSMSMPTLARGAQNERVTVVNPKDAASCDYTSAPAAAKASYVSNGGLLCLLEWTNIPAGLAVDETSTVPSLAGVPTGSGMQKVSGNVSVMTSKGVKIALGSVESTFNAIEPTPPVMGVLPAKGVTTVNYKGDTVYLVPRTGAVGQLKVVTSPLGAVQSAIKENGVLTSSVSDLDQGETTGLQIKPSYPSWEVINVDIGAKVQGMSGDVSSVQPVKMAMLPPVTMAVKVITPLQNLSKTEASNLVVKVVDNANKDVCCDAKQGEWTVFMAESANPTLAGKVSDAVKVGADGAATLKVEPSAIMGKKLVAVAVPSTDIPTSLSLMSQAVSPTFVVTDPISAKIINRATGGALPYGVSMNIAADDPSLANNIGKVTWYVKGPKDASFLPIEGQTSTSLRYTATEAGAYAFKADVANKWSGKLFSTESTQVATYDRLMTTIKGASLALAGDKVTLLANSATSTGQTPEVTYRWTIYELGKETRVVDDQSSIELSSPSGTSFRVTLEAKSKAADASLKQAWSSTTRVIQFGSAPKPRLTYTGNRVCELGMPCTLQVKVMPGWNRNESTNLRLRGQWILPDGTVKDIADPIWTPERDAQKDPTNGLVMLDWTPTEADFLLKTPTVGLRAWVEGDDSSGFTGTQRMVINKYVWPEMAMTSKMGSISYAPGYARLAIEPKKTSDASVLVGKKLTYTWTFPDGVAGKAMGNSANVNIDMVGSYEVKATVSDGRSSSDLSYKIDITAPKPYIMTLATLPALSHNRAPMNFMLRPSYYGGHPSDKPAEWTLDVNGKTVYKGATLPAQLTGLDAGDYDIKLTMKSLFGSVTDASTTVTVNKNTTAECDALTSMWDSTKTSVYMKANCLDKDGKVMSYAWTVNGVLQNNNRMPAWLPIDPSLNSAEIGLQVKDDSGEVSSFSTTVTR